MSTTRNKVSPEFRDRAVRMVNREFRVSRPNALWVDDFTDVHTRAGARF
jgi:hypothetical protein